MADNDNPFSFNPQPSVSETAGDISSNKTLEQTKQKYQGRKPRSDKGRARSAIQQEAIQKAAMEIDAMLTPENMEAVVCLPADMGLAVTGRDLWLLEEREVKTLSVSAATTGKYFWQHDPKWLALTIFAMNFGMVYGTRLVKNFREARKEKQAVVQKRNQAFGTEPKPGAELERTQPAPGVVDSPEDFHVEPLG